MENLPCLPRLQYVYVCMYTMYYMCMCMYVYIHTHVCVCSCICMCVCIRIWCICICMTGAAAFLPSTVSHIRTSLVNKAIRHIWSLRTMPWCKWGSTVIVSSIVFSRESGFSSRSTAIWFLASNGIVGGYRKSLATSAKSPHSIGLLLTSKSCSLPSSVWWSPSDKNNFRETQGLHSKVWRRGQRHLHEMGINPWTSWILFWLLVLLDIQFRCLIRGLNQSKPLWNTWRLSKNGSWVKNRVNVSMS